MVVEESGGDCFNVIEVSNYDLKEANYTYILMTVHSLSS